MRTCLALFLLLFALAAHAQDTSEEAERSGFLAYVENQLSSPNRKIRISGIEGVLSSNASIAEISVADREGIWLRISNARIVWTRSALLRGRLEIDTLAADSIEVLRKPLPEEGAPAPEAAGFQLPELPVAIQLGTLAVPRVTFAQDVFGLGSEISVAGRLSLVDGSLDTALEITRLDGPGGNLTLAATYANASKVLKLDLELVEPANGIVANLLKMDGRPPIVLGLNGSGPLDALDVALTLDAASQRVLTGTATVRRQSDGYGFSTDLKGPVAKIVAPQFREFFGSETALSANGLVRDAGGLLVDRLHLKSQAMTLDASAKTTNDGFLERLALSANIADGTAGKVVLPVPGGETTVENATLEIAFGTTADAWTGSLDISGLTTPDFAAKDLEVKLGGLAQNLSDPVARNITFAAKGAATGVIAKRADTQEALGERIGLDISGNWKAGEPVKLVNARVEARTLSLALAGEIAELAFRGDMAVKAENIAPFSALVGRKVSGALDLDARGSVTPLAGGFDLTLDGSGTDLAVDSEAADAVLAGNIRLTGRVIRNEQGLVAERLRLFNDQLDFGANGRIATGAADFDLDLVLSDIGLLSPKASGRVTAKGRAAGSDGLIGLTFDAAIANGSLAGKVLSDAVLGFEGTLRNEQIDGQLTGTGFVGGERVNLASAVSLTDRSVRLGDLDLSTAGTRLTGAATRYADGLFEGTLALRSPDISTAAALLLLDAKGSVNADLTLAKTSEGKQDVTITATAKAVATKDIRVGAADIQANIEDLLGVPAINGTVTASRVTAGGMEITSLKATAERHLDTTGFVADADLANGTRIGTRGSLSPIEHGYRLGLETLDVSQGALAARLLQPAAITVRGSTFALDGVALDVGGGRVEAAGVIGDKLDLDVTIAGLPLAIANTVRPDLRLAGTLDGTAKVAGTREAPDVRFNLSGTRLAAAALAQAGLRSIDVEASGTSSASRLNLNASVTSPEGLRASVSGGVPLERGGQLALDVELDAFPLAILNAMAPGQNLAGAVSGSARIGGTLANPAADFALRGANVSTSALRDFGAAPLEIAAQGNYTGRAITLSSASFNGPQGLTLSAAGRIPLTGEGLALTLNGNAPLALANRLLAERGAQVSGTVNLSGSVSGSLGRPDIRAMFSTVGANFTDAQSNVRLRDIAVIATIDGQTVTIRNATAAIASGGTVGASGTVSLADGMPANLAITLGQAKYVDRSLVTATLNGALTVTGALARDPLIGGRIDVERAEITVADSLGAKASIDVRHVDPPPGVAATLKRAKANDGTPTPSARPSVARLDLTVSAPRRIFVRGRGLDAELGGSVLLTGPVTNIQPVGAFNLVRGRLSILAQRITFDEGTVTLVGDLDPFINFVARSAGRDITVFVTVSGRVSDPEVVFSSQPELPQDEVLARLIFNRSIDELSPLQIAQLAAAAAELAGGSNTSLLGGLRKATGLDDLDVVTDSEGNAAVRAGRYISDNVYLGVEAGAGGSAKATINLDITEDLKARGSVGTNDSSVGVFYEKDY